jgi:hypothetical protein
MASTAISMPSLGMTMEEGRVVEWRVAIGERVEKGEILLVIESEKSEVEIESIATGHLRHVYVELDEVVPCGSLLAALTSEADEAFDSEAFRSAAAPARAVAQEPREPSTPREADARPAADGGATASSGDAPVAPAARAAARKLGVPIQAVTGTGPGGRVLRQDVEAWAEARRDLVEVADGVRLEAPCSGAGDPVLLLPGFGTDVSVFARQIPALAERHRVIGLNPRGVGLCRGRQHGGRDGDRARAHGPRARSLPDARHALREREPATPGGHRCLDGTRAGHRPRNARPGDAAVVLLGCPAR